ncbi:hypothetical protein LINPERHAP1_LOCUS3979, partial [Linum perenne]
RQLLSQDWTVEIIHIFRERNCVTDLLAYLGHNLNFGSHFNFPISPEIEQAIASDNVGVLFSHLIRNTRLSTE